LSYTAINRSGRLAAAAAEEEKSSSSAALSQQEGDGWSDCSEDSLRQFWTAFLVFCELSRYLYSDKLLICFFTDRSNYTAIVVLLSAIGVALAACFLLCCYCCWFSHRVRTPYYSRRDSRWLAVATTQTEDCPLTAESQQQGGGTDDLLRRLGRQLQSCRFNWRRRRTSYTLQSGNSQREDGKRS
jgi:hypothetical protein